jgi:hypothetical protein
MGCITILVQHAWKMQNQSKQIEGNLANYEINKVARGVIRPISAARKDDLSTKPLSSHVRVTIPSSVAQLVSYYNTCQTIRERKDCELACIDLLYRLEQITHQSTNIDQQKRKIYFQLPAQAGVSISRKHRNSRNQFEKSSLSKGTKYAAEARISILMLSRSNSKRIREYALLLLCEALDTNGLISSEHELMHLHMLWVELVQMLSNVIQVRQLQLSPGHSLTSPPENGLGNGVIACGQKLDIDIQLESLLIVHCFK